MLRLPAAWPQRHGDNVVTAMPPGLGARLRYHERVRPQPSFSTIIEWLLAADPEFRAHEVGPMKRLVTAEGEYGASCVIHGWRGHARALRWLGAVFMGEFATALDLVALAPEKFAEVEALAFELWRSQRFEMTQRPRPFFYAPPPGWHGLPAGLIANWYPPDFPANHTMIVVPPAHVVAGDPARALEDVASELTSGLAVAEHERSVPPSAAGVEGIHVRVRGERDGRASWRELAAFVVDGRMYPLRLETTVGARLDELRGIFRRVASSFHPLPGRDESQAGRAFSARIDVLDHWVG